MVAFYIYCGIVWKHLPQIAFLRFQDMFKHSLLYIDRFKIKCIYNIFFQHFYQIPDLKKETQTKLDDYFSDPFGDEDNEDLLKVMDEIDGVQEKKIKIDS